MPTLSRKGRSMYSRIKLIPYSFGSESCKKLQEKLREITNVPVWRLKHEDPRWHLIKDDDLCIFWGSNTNVAANKLRFFEAASQFDGLNIPDWTTDKQVALSWCREGRQEVAGFARTILTGHSGRGIVPFHHGTNYVEGEHFPDAPLYVKYKKKSHEYRVHVFNGSVIDIVQKKKRAGWENINNQIRNLEGGWVYCREDLEINNKDELSLQALLACNCCKLDFGAVDIIYNSHERKYYVLEVNTAPGLEGQTVTKYAEAIKSFMEQV